MEKVVYLNFKAKQNTTDKYLNCSAPENKSFCLIKKTIIKNYVLDPDTKVIK